MIVRPFISATIFRRHSEFSLPEIQTNKKVEDTKKSKLVRQYSLINAPKLLTERPGNKKDSSAASKHSMDDFALPRLPSATPEPEEIRQLSQRRHSEILETEFRNGTYRPKHCWCLRCQLMFSMFKAGDDRLSMWGNYPCFKRWTPTNVVSRDIQCTLFCYWLCKNYIKDKTFKRVYENIW